MPLICIIIFFSLNSVASAASSLTETIDGIEYTYTVTNDKATITNINYKGFSEIHIPESLGGYEVTSFSGYIMSNVSYNEDLGEEIPVTVYIPKTVTSIYASTFYNNYATYFVVDSENPNYCSDENGILFSKDKTILYRMPQFSTIETYAVPDGVKTIAGYAFNACDNLKEITFPDTLETIGTQSFTYVHHVKKIELPDSVTYISENSFIYCTGLEELKISSSLSTISGSAFSECYSLKKVIIPEGVTSIDRYAFENDQALEEVYLPSSLTKIENGAFGNCISLKDICYAGSEEDWANVSVNTESYDSYRQTVIDEVNFHFNIPVSSYENIKIDCQDGILVIDGTGSIPALAQDTFSYVKENYAGTVTGVVIGEEIDTVGSYFFNNFPMLSHVIISSNSITVEANAFNDCPSLRNVIVFGDSDFDSDTFSDADASINIFVPYDSVHSSGETEKLKSIKYSFSEGILTFDGDVSLNTYDFFDNISAFCLIYDNISAVHFSSLVFDDMQLYYLDDDFNLQQVEGNLLENCDIYPSLTEDPDDAITFNDLVSSISDGSVEHFYLITTSENQSDINFPEFQVMQEAIDFIVRALRWVVTLMNKLFALINKLFK